MNPRDFHRIAIATLVVWISIAAVSLAQCPPIDPGWTLPASNSVIVRPATAVDLNPNPDIVEVNLTATVASWDFNVGNLTEIWTYNGVLPGPTIDVNIGETLVVNFCNDLPDETTIHWHGVETPATMDGSHISQLTVPPNGGTFRYEFKLNKAGMFWYHPHVQTNVQVEKGLYGVILVHDPTENTSLGLPQREHVFVLDDIWLDANGQVVEPFIGTREDVALEALNGREGNTPVFNGMSRLSGVLPQIYLERSVPHRIRMINVANARFMRMSFREHDFWQIGGDQGLLETAVRIPPAVPLEIPPPTAASTSAAEGPFIDFHVADPDPTTGIQLTPGERADLYFYTDLDETRFPAGLGLEWHDTARGRHSVDFNSDGSVTLAHNVPDGNQELLYWAAVRPLDPSPAALPDLPPGELRTLTPIDIAGATALPLTLGHTVPDWTTGQTKFFIQAPMKPFEMLTSDDVHAVELGRTYVWEVKNLTGGHHNFHTHGWSFQHIETLFHDDAGNEWTVPADRLENKDTIFIPRRPGGKGTSWTVTRLAVSFDPTGRAGQLAAAGGVPSSTRSGGWLAHCHILEHSALGMMTWFEVPTLFIDGFETGNLQAWSGNAP